MTHPAYRYLMGLTVTATVAGIATLMPWDSSQANILGYYSLCTFAPAATIFCFFVAALSCTIRASYFSPTALAKGSTARGLNKARLVRLIVILFIGLVPAWFHLRAGIDYDKMLADRALSTRTAPEQVTNPGLEQAPRWKDGLWTGKAKAGDVEAFIEVVVKENALAGLRLVSSRNIPPAVNRILGEEAVAYNSPWVDAVTGATLSSQVWQEALADALSQAVED